MFKLRNKLLIVMLLISLVPIIIVSYMIIEKSYEDIRSKSEVSLLNLVDAKSRYYESEFKSVRIDLEAFASYISSHWGKGKYYNMSYIWIAPEGKKHEKYENELKNFEIVDNAFQFSMCKKDKVSLAYFTTKSGICFVNDCKLIDKLRKEIKYFEPRERIWYRLALEKNKTVWTPLYIDVNTGELVTTISCPVYANGKFIGVAGFDLLLSTIRNDILDIKFENQGYPLLVEKNGRIIVHPEYTAAGKKWNESFEEENIFNISGLSKIGKEIENGSKGFKIVYLDNEKQYAFFSPIDEINGSLVFIVPERAILKSIDEMKKNMLLFALLIAILIAIIAIFFSHHLTSPLEKLQQAMKEIAKGNLDYKIDIRGNDEIARLAREFNEMVKEIKKSKKALEESEEKYRKIFEESTDTIYISTPSGRFIDINKAGEKLFGYTREELLNMNVENLYAEKKDREKFKKEIEKKGFVRDYELKLKRKDGKLLDCLLSTVLIKKGDKTFYQGIIRDITPVKEAKKQLEMYNSLLRHDISNKNQIALGCLQLLMEEQSLNKEHRELIEKAYEHLVHSQELLQKLGILNKVENIKLKKINLKDALKKSIEKFEYLAKEKGIKVTYENKDAYVLADELLENIFSNLIENSIKHANCKNIEISINEGDDEYIITLKDDGKGIPDEIVDSVFEWGVKGKESKGAGMGLHLTKMIIEGYGGKILLKKADKGTVFEIHLKKSSVG